MEIGAVVRETAETVVGWRVWTVTQTTAGLRLGSVLHELVWTIDEPALAECRRDEDPFAGTIAAHPVPGRECNCGFHAARDPADALSYLRGRDEAGTVCRILGEVALWGHVVETEAGWRASHAYPTRLYAADPAVADALSLYGIPVLSPDADGVPGAGRRVRVAGGGRVHGAVFSCAPSRRRNLGRRPG